MRGQRVNHFGLLRYLIDTYPLEIRESFSRVHLFKMRALRNENDVILMPRACIIAKQVLKQYPFSRVFTPLRKLMILRILEARANRLRELFEIGGRNVQNREI
jgi:hypothetical protein